MTRTGIVAVTRLEFLLRVRAGRWKWLLGGWFALLTLIMAGTRQAFVSEGAIGTAGLREIAEYRGAAMFGVLMLCVLGLGLLVAPVLAAQSVNGDRDRGTLATLQVTRLSAGEIAVGKWLAAWSAVLVLLAATVPLTIWCFFENGLSPLRALGGYVVTGVLLGVVCAMALGLSAWLTRTTTSSLVAYLGVFALAAGTAAAFAMVTALTTEEHRVAFTTCTSAGQTEECFDGAYVQTVARPDRTWWLLAPNPFVVLADAAPAQPTVTVRTPTGPEESAPDFDPLGMIAEQTDELRIRPVQVGDRPGGGYQVPDGVTGDAVWPFGLAANLLLGAGGLVLATRRLRMPTYRLAKGQRVA